jgi:hypothetical protein
MRGGLREWPRRALVKEEAKTAPREGHRQRRMIVFDEYATSASAISTIALIGAALRSNMES